MKKILIGTTALVAAGLIAGGASAAEKMKVGVSGYQHLFLIYGSQSDNAGEPANNLRNHGIRKEGEVHFKAKTTMDNGIKIGWEGEFEAEATNTDENFVWLEGGFGRVTIGGYWGPSLLMSHNAPGGAPGWGDFANNAPATAPANSAVGGPNSYAAFTFKSDKIAYYTPVMGPIRIGVAYTLDLGVGPNGNGNFTTDASAATARDLGATYEIAVELKQKFGGGNVAAYGTYLKAKEETTVAGFGDRTAYAVGVTVTTGAFSVGAGYKNDDEGETGDNDEKHFGIGGAYSTGPWKVALNYTAGADANGGGAGAEDDMTFLQLSGAYSWGPGVTLGAGIQNTKWTDGGSVAADENNATIAFFGTALSF